MSDQPFCAICRFAISVLKVTMAPMPTMIATAIARMVMLSMVPPSGGAN
jgi:hypothetical protein